MWIYYLENFGYIALAFGQRQVMLSLLGFIAMLLISWSWRRAALQSLLSMWLLFWVWMLPLSLMESTQQQSGTLGIALRTVHEHVQQWLPLQILSPCGLPYVERLSSDFSLLPLLSWNKLALTLWLLLSAGKTLSVLNQRRQLTRIAKNAQPVDEPHLLAAAESWQRRFKLSRSVAVRSSRDCNQAFTLGVFRPVVFVPEQLVQHLNHTEIEAVLGHEFAHIKRYDDVFVCLQLVSKCILFFNPMMWLSARHITSLRERCCDLLAIQASGLPAQSYAKSLLRVAELQGDTMFDCDAVAGLTSSALTERVRNSLTPPKNHFSIVPLLTAAITLSAFSFVFTSNSAGLDTIRGSEAKMLFAHLGAVSPMPRVKNLENFIGAANETCSLPQRNHYHPGVDFAPAIDGDRSVNAIADGKIAGIISSSAYFESMLQISHADNVISTYVHLSNISVKIGDRVHAGQSIGTLGGNHLHLEVRKGLQLVDPSGLREEPVVRVSTAATM